MFLFPAESLLWLGFAVCNEFLMTTAKHYGHVWASKAFIEVLDKVYALFKGCMHANFSIYIGSSKHLFPLISFT